MLTSSSRTVNDDLEKMDRDRFTVAMIGTQVAYFHLTSFLCWWLLDRYVGIARGDDRSASARQLTKCSVFFTRRGTNVGWTALWISGLVSCPKEGDGSGG